jgi:hypothetical protein
MNNTSSQLASGTNICFKGYLLENVYLRTTEGQRSEIVEFWRKEGSGLAGPDSERSSREAVFLVRTGSGELAGVSTVALVRVKGGQRFYSYSMFLRKRDRVPNLAVAVCNATRDFLRTFKHPVSQPVGMLNVNENPKLMRPGMRRLFARLGFRYWGQTALGEDVWITEFSEPAKPGLSSSAVCATAPGNAG